MNFFLHLIRTDLRRLRGSVLAWALLLAMTPTLGWLLVATDLGAGPWFETIVMWRVGLMFVEFCAGLVLVPLVIHGDPVVGDSAFWMSRPISPARLWWAKASTLALLFAALPILVLLPWWLYCGFGVTEIALAAGDTLLWQAVLIGFALPLAALTSGLMRFGLWLLVVLAATMTASVFWLVTPEYLARVAYDLAFVWTRAWLALGVFLVGGVIVAAWQFHTRRFSQSVVLFAIVAALAVVVIGYWPRQFTPAPPPPVDVVPGRFAGDISLAFNSARVLRTSRDKADIQVSLAFKGVPDDRILTEVWDLEHEASKPAAHLWTWGQGLQIERSGWVSQGSQGHRADWAAMGLPRPPPDPEPAIIAANERRRKAGLAPIDRPAGGRWGELRVQVPPAFVARVKDEAPGYHLRLHLDLLRPKFEGECAAESGQSLRFGSSIVRIKGANFDRGDSTPAPVLIETEAMLLARSGLWGVVPMLRSATLPPRSYYLVNRARGNAVAFYIDNFRVGFGAVGIYRRELPKSAPWDWQDGKWTRQSDWFHGLTLAALSHAREERFFKELSVERFTLQTDAATQVNP
jgi:hypothetical protein